ncbi:hypothetical protein ACFQVC_35530 [Streptomyces monticola]|uniref:DUF2059 domain-containing protein n=1 Tax=Streptomyces monticola TaxID=2666263 RepID=A0ABW2JTJ5_9ACTN
MSRMSRIAAASLLALTLGATATVPAFAAAERPAAATVADDDIRQAVRTFLARYAPELSASQSTKIAAATEDVLPTLLKRPDLKPVIAKAQAVSKQWEESQLTRQDVDKVLAAFVEESVKAKPLDEETRHAVEWLGAKGVMDVVQLTAIAEFIKAVVPA